MTVFHAKIAKETVAIMNRRSLAKDVLGLALEQARTATLHVKEEDALSLNVRSRDQLYETVLEVTSEDTLTAGQRLIAEGYGQPCVLNFADAFLPGGLFLHGVTTQEERLARCTGLYWCIKDQEYYARNKEARKTLGGLFLHDLLYSRDVPVFRNIDNEEELLDDNDLYNIAIVTCPAPFGTEAKDHLEVVMKERIRRILAVMANHEHEAIVLGAYGCGAFVNDPSIVATTFKTWLDATYHGYFKKIVFGIYDKGDSENISTFRRVLL